MVFVGHSMGAALTAAGHLPGPDAL
jgi:hypothetical protein